MVALGVLCCNQYSPSPKVMQAVAIELPIAVEYFICHPNHIDCSDQIETDGLRCARTIWGRKSIDLDRKSSDPDEIRLVVRGEGFLRSQLAPGAPTTLTARTIAVVIEPSTGNSSGGWRGCDRRPATTASTTSTPAAATWGW